MILDVLLARAAAQLRRDRLPAGAAGQHAVARRVPRRWRARHVAAAAARCSAGPPSTTTSCGTRSCWSRGLRAGLARAGLAVSARRPAAPARCGASRPGPSTRSSAGSPGRRGLASWCGSSPVRCAAGLPRRWPGPSAARASCDDRPVRCRPQTDQLFAGLPRAARPRGLPARLRGVRAEPIPPVAAAGPRGRRRRGRRAAAASVVKITGVAAACSRGQEGSGWVVAPGRVVTNAHVVAGHDPPPCGSRGIGRPYARAGRWSSTRERDLAVLDVRGLRAPAAARGGDQLGRGDEAVVAGFPLRRPVPAGPARVRDGPRRPRRGHLRRAGRRARGLLALRARRSRATPAARCSSRGRRGRRRRLRQVAWTTTRTGYALTLDEAGPGPRRSPGGDRDRSAPAAAPPAEARRGGRWQGSAEAVEPADEVGVDGVRGLLGQEVAGAGDDVLLVAAR